MDLMQLNQPTTMGPRAKAFFKWVLVAGLVIVTNLFVNYAIDAFYKMPQFEDFCEAKQVQPLIKTEKACTDQGGQWTETPPEKSIIVYQGEGSRPVAVPAPEVGQTGYCNLYFTCQKEFDSAFSVYNRNVFLVLVVVGVALVIGSYYVAMAGAVSLGFALAGIISLIIGSVRYWSDMDERLRVVVLGVALAALIWYGIKKFRE